MLSPHEFATLMLVGNAPDQVDMTRADLDALVQHQLVALETLPSGREYASLTLHGRSVLERMNRRLRCCLRSAQRRYAPICTGSGPT